MSLHRPFHSVFGPCLLVSLDLSLISDLVLGSSPGTRAHSLPDLPGGRSPCSLLFHRLGCFWDKFDIFLLLSWRILVLCSFSGRRRRSYLADLLAASLESLEGLVRFLPSFGRSLFGLVPHEVSTTQSLSLSFPSWCSLWESSKTPASPSSPFLLGKGEWSSSVLDFLSFGVR